MDHRWAAVLAFTLLGYVFAIAEQATAQSSAGERAAYEDAGCWSCHGYEGQGGRPGPAIARPTMAYAAFSKFVRTSSRAMPPYTGRVLSDDDLEAIYAYLRSIPEPPAPETLPLLQP